MLLQLQLCPPRCRRRLGHQLPLHCNLRLDVGDRTATAAGSPADSPAGQRQRRPCCPLLIRNHEGGVL